MRSCRLHLLSMAFVLLAVAPACAAARQDVAPPRDPPAAPAPPAIAPGTGTAPATTRPQAGTEADAPANDAATTAGLALLDAAARFQRGEHALARRPASLHGRFYVGVRDKDGALIKASVERWYTAAPERLLTSRTESVTGSRSTVGFDGTRAWFRDDTTGQVIVYTDAPEIYEVDLDLLQEQLRLTRLLLDASVLDALVPRLQSVRAAGREELSDPDGESHAVQHVSAHMPDELFPPAGASGAGPAEPGRLDLDFAIDVETGALWALRVTAAGRQDVAPLDLRFAFHGRTRSGLRVPGNIKLYQGGETVESANLGVDEDDEQHLVFEVDAPIDPALFAVPQR